MCIVQFQKKKKQDKKKNIMTLPTEGFWFCFTPPPPPPPGNSGLCSYIASKILALKTRIPLGISNVLHGVGMDFFWNYTLPTFARVGRELIRLRPGSDLMPVPVHRHQSVH